MIRLDQEREPRRIRIVIRTGERFGEQSGNGAAALLVAARAEILEGHRG